RKSHKVELSQEGEVFLPYARQLYNIWQGAQEHLLQRRLMEQSEIHLACAGMLGSYLIPSLVYLFRQRNPFVTVVSHLLYSNAVAHAVEQGIYPVGILGAPLTHCDKLICEKLTDDPLILVVNPSHPFARRGSIRVQELLDEQFVISSQSNAPIRFLEKTADLRLPPENLHPAGNIEDIKQGVYDNRGIAVMSEFAVRQELELGLLRSVHLLDLGELTRPVYYILQKGQPIKLSTQLFLEFAGELGDRAWVKTTMG
ncbi:MAG: LysR substrate-binding domain-containing protein, partial [Angelakisella sp.]